MSEDASTVATDSIAVTITAAPATTTTTAPPAVSTPDAPVITGVEPGIHELRVEWSVPDDGGSEITGYTITAGPTAGSTATKSDRAVTADVGPDTTSVTINGPTAGTEYAVTVTATNAAGTSEASEAASAAPLGYSAPLLPGYSLPGSDGEAPEIDVPDGVELISIISTPSGERG